MIRLKLMCLIILVSGCGQRDVLIENTWVLIGGTFHGKEIDFHNTDPMVMTAVGGGQFLLFGKDETITLPGINSGRIPARWTIIEGKIFFSIDSLSPSNFRGTIDARIFDDSTYREEPVDRYSKFRMPMKIYGQAFDYHISQDTLRMFSRDTRLWAVRDRRVQELFEHMR